MSVLLIGGSPAPQSGSARLLQHIGDRLTLLGHRSHRIHVRDLPAEALLHADFADAAIVRALALVHEADAVVIATPVYKASYTGILKAFLDLLPQGGLAGKLVLPLATGGSQSHMLALDLARPRARHAGLRRARTGGAGQGAARGGARGGGPSAMSDGTRPTRRGAHDSPGILEQRRIRLECSHEDPCSHL